MTGEHPVWEMVDEGWGRKAVDFATLAEPNSVREYVTMQHRLGVDRGDRLVDVACGSGLALELAGLRGASCAGIDASRRLIAVARDRNPDADLRVGDMYALPWPDASFDVATSFRGIWGTTPEALAEIHRVLRPGCDLVLGTRRYTAEQIRWLLENCGMEVGRVESEGDGCCAVGRKIGPLRERYPGWLYPGR